MAESRRFIASGFTEPSIQACFTLLQTETFLIYSCRSASEIYLETKSKTVFRELQLMLPYLPNLEDTLFHRVIMTDIIEEMGTPLTPLTTPPITFNWWTMTPSTAFSYVRYYKQKPRFSRNGGLLSPRLRGYDFAGELDNNFQNSLEFFDEYPWQRQALQILKEQDNYQVLWIYTMDSNDGKKEMLKYLIDAHQFQFFSGDTPRVLATKLDEEAHGYCFELMEKDQKKNPAFLNFIQNIKDQHIQQRSLEKHPSSSRVVVVSDYMPNLNYYSMARWVFFHTKLGLVHLSCEPQEGRKYKCSIAPMIGNSVSKFKIKPCSTTDEELNEQYLNIHSGKLSILLANELAFPKIVRHHKEMTQQMIENSNFTELNDYIQKNLLLEDSIARNTDFIRGPSAQRVGVVRIRDPESARPSAHPVEEYGTPPASKIARRH